MTSLCTAKMKIETNEEKRHCNIPKVRFLGTLRDWLLLRKKITYLDRYGCHKWLDSMLPVINKFIKAIEEDEIDKEFWEAHIPNKVNKLAGKTPRKKPLPSGFAPEEANNQPDAVIVCIVAGYLLLLKEQWENWEFCPGNAEFK